MQESSFPKFKGADVKIVLTDLRHYELYSTDLCRQSPFFAHHIRSLGVVKLAKAARARGITAIYRFRLCEADPRDEHRDGPRYVLQPYRIDHHGRETGPALSGAGSSLGGVNWNENGRVLPPEISAYHHVLGAFYNEPIELGGANRDHLSEVLAHAVQIVDVAAYLGVVHIIQDPVKAALLSLGQPLYKCIATSPCVWLSFSRRIKSELLFREALIHAVGQYNTPAIQDCIANHRLSPSIEQLLVERGKALVKQVKATERNLNSTYSPRLRQPPDPAVGVSRADYAGNIMAWLALVVVRGWLTDQLIQGRGHTASDCGYALFAQLDDGGTAYLSRQDMQQFYQVFPMSTKGATCVERRMNEIKASLKAEIQPLMQHTAQLDRRLHPVDYFTCLDVQSLQLPLDDDDEDQDADMGNDQDFEERDSDEQSYDEDEDEDEEADGAFGDYDSGEGADDEEQDEDSDDMRDILA